MKNLEYDKKHKDTLESWRETSLDSKELQELLEQKKVKEEDFEFYVTQEMLGDRYKNFSAMPEKLYRPPSALKEYYMLWSLCEMLHNNGYYDSTITDKAKLDMLKELHEKKSSDELAMHIFAEEIGWYEILENIELAICNCTLAFGEEQIKTTENFVENFCKQKGDKESK